MFIKKSNIKYIVPAVSGMFWISITFAQEQQGYSIIDTAHDSRPYLSQLSKKGIRVIGRYYGRCKQDNLPEKRIIDNVADNKKGSEINEIRSHDFKVLSVYQYLSNSPCKVFGREGQFEKKKNKNGDTVKVQAFKDKAKTIPACLGPLLVPSENNKASCIVPKQQNTAYKEGKLDAKYAIEQASLIGQPNNSVIYFGMDFDYKVDWKIDNTRVCLNVLEYFKGVRDEISAQSIKYKIGAYGNGLTFLLLTGKLKGRDFDICGKNTEKLIDNTLLSASTAYTYSKDYLASNEWDIFQKETDKYLGRLRVDYNVKNKDRQDEEVGFWGQVKSGMSGDTNPP